MEFWEFQLKLLSPFLRSCKDFFPVFKLPHPSSLSHAGALHVGRRGLEGQPCALVALGRALRPCLLCAHLCIPEEEGVTQFSVWWNVMCPLITSGPGHFRYSWGTAPHTTGCRSQKRALLSVLFLGLKAVSGVW